MTQSNQAADHCLSYRDPVDFHQEVTPTTFPTAKDPTDKPREDLEPVRVVEAIETDLLARLDMGNDHPALANLLWL